MSLLCATSLLLTTYAFVAVPVNQMASSTSSITTPRETGPLGRYIDNLNGALSILVALSGLLQRRTTSNLEGFWLLCLLPLGMGSQMEALPLTMECSKLCSPDTCQEDNVRVRSKGAEQAQVWLQGCLRSSMKFNWRLSPLAKGILIPGTIPLFRSIALWCCQNAGRLPSELLN